MNIIQIHATSLLPKYSNREFIGDSAVSHLKKSAIYKECRFINAHLKEECMQCIICENCTFKKIICENCDIQLSSFTNNHFISCKYIKCNAPYSGFNNTKWVNCLFLSCELSYSRFLHANFTNLLFEDCNIDSVLFNILYEDIRNKIEFLYCNTEEAFFGIT